MTDVVNKLWGYCGVLRHDGIDYGDYVEQLTYLLFIKMADESGVELPAETDWPFLRKQSGTTLLELYAEALRVLGKESGMLGDIFSGSQSRFGNPVNLHRLIRLIDETDWTSLDTDIKAAAFEGLLEKAASEGKKGAGQYFTPRILIQTIVRCVKPDPREHDSFSICDPACGTGGFLVAAYEWLKAETGGGALDRDTAIRVRTSTYYGQELVAQPRRLALMNLFLHRVEPQISLGDSIYEAAPQRRFDVVLTNPPFGTKGANQSPVREDFAIQLSNKQLNFIQHVLTILKQGGRAAIVVPDNVLFDQQAGEVFQLLMEDCDVHTVLRCPRGTFSPYSEGTMTYVLFLTKGSPTSRTWIYDARANVPKVTKKTRPLTPEHFAEFETCYGSDPYGRSNRTEQDSPSGRWRSFSIDEIRGNHYKLDAFKWIRDDELGTPGAQPEPEELLTEAMERLHLAIDSLANLRELLETAAQQDAPDLEAAPLPASLSHSEAPHLVAAKQAVEGLRMALLSEACEGRLTADWRERHAPETPESLTTAAKRPKQLRPLSSYDVGDLPPEWRWVQVNDILPVGGIFDGPFGSNLKSADYTPTGARVIRLENIEHLRFVGDKRTFVSNAKYEALLKHAVFPGDIVFSSFVEEKIRVCILPASLDAHALAKADCFTLRPKGHICPQYLAMQLACRRTFNFLVTDVHGATRPRVNTTQVRSLPIPLCSLDEQREIVRRFRAAMQTLGALDGPF